MYCSLHQVEYEASRQKYKDASGEADRIDKQLSIIRREISTATDLEEVLRSKEVVEAYLDARRRELIGRREHSRIYFNSQSKRLRNDSV